MNDSQFQTASQQNLIPMQLLRIDVDGLVHMSGVRNRSGIALGRDSAASDGISMFPASLDIVLGIIGGPEGK